MEEDLLGYLGKFIQEKYGVMQFLSLILLGLLRELNMVMDVYIL